MVTLRNANTSLPESARQFVENVHPREFQQGGPSRDKEVYIPHHSRDHYRSSVEYHNSSRHALPKLSFPLFNGVHPSIWKDKFLDFFHFYNVPESLWVTTASLHMDKNAAKWYKTYKLMHGVGTWSEFIAAVEQQFGSYEYRDATRELVSLYQDGTVDEYIFAFVDLQYQLTMHNTGTHQVYFVTRFIKGKNLNYELEFSLRFLRP